MRTPSPDETTAPAAPAAPARTVIRAEPGKPWPDPPHGGRWSRNPTTGDLTLEDPPTQRPSDEERRARRDKQRADALKASNPDTKE